MSKKIIISEISPVATTLAGDSLGRVDYRDALVAEIASNRFQNIDALARNFFRQQPAWLRAMSMGVARRSRIEKILEKTALEPGQKVGSWQIFQRDQTEIVFGQEMGFMSYRLALSLLPQPATDRVSSSTAVQLNSNFGKVYFAGVKLLHLPLVKIMLRNALKTA